jgi:hypothetical protein
MPATETLDICAHLAPYYNDLLASGAALVARDTGWSECKLNLLLSQGPQVADMQANWNLADYLEPWAGRDPHYAIENGLFCTQCKIGLSWPHAEPC